MAEVARASLAALARAHRCQNSAYFIQYSSFFRLDPEPNPRRDTARDFSHGLLGHDEGVGILLLKAGLGVLGGLEIRERAGIDDGVAAVVDVLDDGDAAVLQGGDGAVGADGGVVGGELNVEIAKADVLGGVAGNGEIGVAILD